METDQSPIALTQLGIRQTVCCECDRRPAGSESLPAAEARACERGCAVFLLLPRICDLVGRHRTEPPCGYGLAVRNLLRHASESGALGANGDPSSGVPLDRHAEAALAVVQHVLLETRTDRRAS